MDRIDFSVILASTVHDTKNSLSLLMQSLDELIADAVVTTPEQTRRFAVIHYEATRVNNDLIQMLALYKLNQAQLPLNLNMHPLLDFLEDQMLRYATLLDTRNIGYDIDCDDTLSWVFDADLVAGILNNVITNTLRYTRDHVSVSARQEGKQLVLEIADNGKGYPASMIEQQGNYLKSISFATGSTGLGLHFATEIARLHTKEGVAGHIQLDNGGRLGGGIFRLYLP